MAWPQLPEAIRESNRSQANHISDKLRAIDCDIVPLADWNAADFPFSPEETELMAKMEHERWSEERRAQGWSYGPRDETKKTNPSLLPWPELPTATRDWNRAAVREIPASLERAGLSNLPIAKRIISKSTVAGALQVLAGRFFAQKALQVLAA